LAAARRWEHKDGVFSIKASEFPIPELPNPGPGPRRQPLDLGPLKALTSEIRIHVPPEAKVIRLPAEARFSFAQGRYESTVQNDFKVLIWRRTLVLEESQVPPEGVAEYAGLLAQIRASEEEALEFRLP
jgi:hypothetical protein